MKIRMYEEVLKKLKALSDIISIDTDLEFNEVLQKILKISCETMNALSGNIMIVENDMNELKIVSSYGLSENNIENLNASERKAGDQISIPMKKGSKVFGVLNIHMKEVNKFSEEEIYFLNVAASSASSIVQNARICKKLKGNILKLNEYEHLFENAQDPMYTLDLNGSFLAMNHVALTALGVKKEDIIGTNLSEWLTPASMEIARQRLKNYSRGIQMGSMIYEMVKKDGEHIWAEVNTRLIKDGEKITGLHGIARDVTEKKKLEQELKESEAKFKDLFENADDPMYTIDTKGFFKTINKAGVRILGGMEEEIIGSHISEWLTPESMKYSQEVLEKQINGNTWEDPVIIEVVTRNGMHKFGEAKTRILTNGNEIIGVHGVVRDITEKMKLEQKVRDYHEKLEKSYEELLH